jgi:release factor glutamine methyltransferase
LLDAVEVPSAGYDAIAANLPYIPSEDLRGLAPEVRDWEPRAALDGGPDGLVIIRRSIAQIVARKALASGGRLLLEVGIGQAEAVEALLLAAGFTEVGSRSDYARIPRVVAGIWPG